MTGSRSRPDYYFLASIGGAAILLLVTLLLPLGFDNDVYQSMGWTLYAYHGLPYLASWDMNFPGIVFVHWASIALFGSSDFGFRLFDYFAHIVLVVLYYFVLRRWLTKQECLIAVIIYAIYYATGQLGLEGQRDEYAVFFLLAATLVYLRIFNLYVTLKPGVTVVRVGALLIGFFSGIAFLFRPTYIFFSLTYALLMLWGATPRPTPAIVEAGREKKILNLLLITVGAILPLSALLTLYAFQPDGLEQLYYSVIRFNLDIYASIYMPKYFFTIGRGPIYVVAVIGLSFLFRFKKSETSMQHPDTIEVKAARRDRILLYLLTASSLLSPIIMGKYFTYHLSPFMMIVIGFAATGLNRLAELIKQPKRQRYAIVFALALFAAGYYPKQLIRIFLYSIGSPHPVEKTYEIAMHDSLFGIRAEKDVVEYIDSKIPRSMPVECATFYPSLEWRLGRPMPTRFTTLLPLVPLSNPEPDYIRAWRREFIQSLADVRPRYVICSRFHDWWPFANTYEDSATHVVPGLDSLIAANYEHDTAIRGFTIYHIRP